MSAQPGSPPSAGRGSTARWWLVLCLVLAVVATGTAVGLRAILSAGSPDPSVAPPQVPGTRAADPGPAQPPEERGAPVLLRDGPGPLLPGAGSGQVYVQSATGIFRMELATGRVSRTVTPDLEGHATFLAGPDWVLVKSRWSPTGVLVRDGQPAAPLPHPFDREGFLHLAPGGRLWTEPEPSTDPRPTTTLHLVELDGRPVPGRSVTASRAMAPYGIVADGYGGLILTNAEGVHRLGTSRPGRASRARLVTRGDLVAAGGRRLLVWDCSTRSRCDLVLLDERTRERASRPEAARTLRAADGVGTDRNTYGGEMLSPDGDHLAVMADDASGFRAHVIDLRSGKDTVLPGTGTASNANRQLAWSANSRWAFALTDGQLRAYDTRTGAVRDLSLGGEPLLHLTSAHAPAW